MAENICCAACGCSVSADDVSSGRAHRIQGRVYCAECSALLVEPQDHSAANGTAAAGAINEAETQPSIFAVGSVAAAGGADGIETLEEWEIHVNGDAERESERGDAAAKAPAPPRRMKRFSRGRSAGGHTGGSRPAKHSVAGRPPTCESRAPFTSAAKSSSAVAKPNSGSGKPSQGGVKPPPVPRSADEKIGKAAAGCASGAVAGGSQDREILYRSGKAPGAVGQEGEMGLAKGGTLRASGRKTSPSSRRSSGIGMPSDRNASSRSVPSSSESRSLKKGSSRLIAAAKSSERRISSRLAAGSADETGVRMSERARKSGGAFESRNFIYACAAGGVLLIVLVIALAFGSNGGRGMKRWKDRGGETGLPVAVLVQKAEQCKREGKTIEAADYYRQAAEAAERAGDSETASAYIREAYTLQKFTPLNLKKY